MKNTEARVMLSDGVERAISFDLDGLERIHKETGENPMDPSFWTTPTGAYEADENGKIRYFDGKGEVITPESREIGQPKRLMQNNLTPTKVKVLIWIGLNVPELTLDIVSHMVNLSNLNRCAGAIFELFTGVGDTSDPFVTSAPSQE